MEKNYFQFNKTINDIECYTLTKKKYYNQFLKSSFSRKYYSVYIFDYDIFWKMCYDKSCTIVFRMKYFLKT